MFEPGMQTPRALRPHFLISQNQAGLYACAIKRDFVNNQNASRETKQVLTPGISIIPNKKSARRSPCQHVTTLKIFIRPVRRILHNLHDHFYNIQIVQTFKDR